MIEGTLTITIDGKTYTAHAGDRLYQQIPKLYGDLSGPGESKFYATIRPTGRICCKEEVTMALGLIETKGTLAAVEAADAMVKAADVTLIEKTRAAAA